ncbi:hypothetical protein ACG93T_14580 [Acinetobacter beijerinckii]|uniref:hypothetical protein n=1 Tax=Acinetobacter beijerinckii TaxID=262668 RepID=UPI003AF53A69
MLLNTIYLWEPEIFTGKVPAEDDSHQAALELHHQYGKISSHGKTLKAWLDLFSGKICDPEYQNYFTDQTQQWVSSLKEQFSQGLFASVQLDVLALEAQNDALYRVFYEAVHATGVGCYEPNYNIWAIGELQSPQDAISTMLQPYLLAPLIAKQTETHMVDKVAINRSEFQIPQNMNEAEQLMRKWFQEQSYTRDLKLNVFNIAHDYISRWGSVEHPERSIDTGYRCFLLTQQYDGIFYQLKLVLRKLTISPMVSFAIDMTNRFIPTELQEQIPERLIFRLRPVDVVSLDQFSQKDKLSFDLSGRWDSTDDIHKFFSQLDAYINFIFSNLGHGNIDNLQAWAYQVMPLHQRVDLDFRVELMMIALSQDHDFLNERYQFYKTLFIQNNLRAHDLFLLEDSYKCCQKIIAIVQNERTCLSPFA